MGTKDRLVQIVTAEPSKYYEAELGRMLEVSRQWVHTIAVEEEVHHLIKRYPSPSTNSCLHCGKRCYSQLRLCRSCRREYFRAECSCDECGKVFIQRRCVIARYKHHFCSQRCRGKYFLQARMECVCDECGQVFMRRRCDIARYKHHFCSHRCKGKYFW